MFDVLRFWLWRGVDGFRVDVIWLLIKDTKLRDNPPNPDYRPTDPASTRFLSRYNANQPETHEVVFEMRSLLEQHDERVLIGEIYLPIEQLVAYYGKDLRGAHLPFNFQLIQTAWPALAARAQPTGPVRLIGVLMDYAESDPVSESLIAVFRDDLAKLGW